MEKPPRRHRPQHDQTTPGQSEGEEKQQLHHPKRKKWTVATVFVRFRPPSTLVKRHHLEEVFSRIGPLKRSAVIQHDKSSSAHSATATSHNPTSSSAASHATYGFVKFTSPADAERAVQELQGTTIQVAPTEILTMHLELANQQSNHEATSSLSSSVVMADPSEKNKRDTSAKSSSSGMRTHPATKSSTSTTSSATSSAQNYHHQRRVIVRNLSFYAKESHIRQVLEQRFGPLVECHIPPVPRETTTSSQPHHPTTHRGFAFCTFAHAQHAAACIQAAQPTSADPLIIYHRPVHIAYSQPKDQYQQKKAQNTNPQKELDQCQKEEEIHDESDNEGEEEEDGNDNDEDEDDEAKKQDDEEEEEVEEEEDQAEEEEDDNDEGEEKTEEGSASPERKSRSDYDSTAVREQRCLFVRNLPFDTNRHDVFQLFCKFGYLTGVYLVHDKVTGVFKGTAFVSFRENSAAGKALEAARGSAQEGDDAFVPQRQQRPGTKTSADGSQEPSPVPGDASSSETGLTLKGRRLLVDLAVDKETAATIAAEKDDGHASTEKKAGRDRRHLYLKGEGRINNTDPENGLTEWDDLPEGDKLKRQSAWTDKNTKLRSPIFFINPTRLSIRNLAKHVEESDLKRLCVEATTRGLERNLVSSEDQIAHWKAAEGLSTREILSRVQQAAQTQGKDIAAEALIIPPFDTRNIKKFISSVSINRDFSTGKESKDRAPSRGFGFVEFQHHAHALACLRELNNNVAYAAEFVSGGKQAVELKRKSAKRKNKKHTTKPGQFVSEDGEVRIPRLIVEFAVENKVKAKEQAIHRAHQQANSSKQKLDHRQKKLAASSPREARDKKRSRGAAQRERKRKQRESGSEGADGIEGVVLDDAVAEAGEENDTSVKEVKKRHSCKPTKKRKKVEEEEENFSKLVESYTRKFQNSALSGSEEKGKAIRKRWFELK